MPVTGLRGRQILDGDVLRNDLNTTTSGSAVITKIIAGTNITISSTGADAGTGDVTINASGGTGTVTSVGLSLPNIFSVSGSPVTGAGTLTGTLVSQTANTIFAAPNGSNGTPSFRTLVQADIPDLTLEKIPDAWVKRSVRVATTANITLSGTQTIDGVSVVAGDRVLVKNQTTTANNGIYVVASGTWSRAADANTSLELAAASVGVDSGTTNGGFTFDTDFKSTDTLGSTAMTWNRVLDSGSGAALTRTDDTNVTLTLGGSPTTALINATSLTLGWTGQLAVGRGGSGASTLTGVLIGNGTSAFTGVTGTASQLLRRNAGNTAYEFFTHSFASTGTGTTNTIAKYTNSNTIGNSTITDSGTTITLLGTTTFIQAASLGAQIGGTLTIVDDYSSPIAARIIFGDGTGWSLPISRRNTSVTTDLFTFKDSGQLQLNLYTTTTSFTGTLVGYLGYDSSGNVICSTGTGGGGGGISGSGTTNKIPLFTGSTAIGDSILTQNSTIGINLTSASEAQLYIQGGGSGYTQGNIMLQTETSGASARGLGLFLFNATNQTMWFAGNGYTDADAFYIGRKTSTIADTSAADPVVTNMFFKLNNAGHLHLGSSVAGGTYISFNRSGTTNYAYVGNSSHLFLAGFNGNTELGLSSVGAINFGIGSTAVMRIQTTGQLRFVNYTSASSFTGTAAGMLGFDSSGNIITMSASGGGSQWTTSGVNIYYTAGGVSIGTTTTADILHIGRAVGNNTYIRFNQDTRTTWKIGQEANTDPFRIFNVSTGLAAAEFKADRQLVLNGYTAFNSFSNTDAQGILGFDTSGNIISMYAPIYRHAFVSASPVTANNIPSNISFFASSNTYVTKMDLTGKKRARLHGRVSTAGTSTSVLRVRYATTFSTTASSYLTMGSSEIEISLSATGHFDSGWINLVAGAKADVFIALLTQGGDGAADPVLNQVVFETEE